MSVAYYINTEHELEGQDPVCDLDGKALASAAEHFEREQVYESLQVRPIEEFFGADGSDEFAEEFEEVGHVPEGPIWFEPEEGIHTISGLREYVLRNESKVLLPNRVIEDLEAMLEVLTECKRCGIRWHLCVDF